MTLLERLERIRAAKAAAEQGRDPRVRLDTGRSAAASEPAWVTRMREGHLRAKVLVG